jgi:hypothetical protein
MAIQINTRRRARLAADVMETDALSRDFNVNYCGPTGCGDDQFVGLLHWPRLEIGLLKPTAITPHTTVPENESTGSVVDLP